MKHIATMALMLNLGVAGLYAHEKPVKMTFSGTEGSSAIDLKVPDPNTGHTHTGEFTFAGSGTLGSFTFRNVEANGDSPQQSSNCSANQIYSQTLAGAAVFRFQDGSLLKVNLTEGFDCIDFTAGEAHCTRIFQITGGTGRFKDASGTLTLTEIAAPVMADAAGNARLFYRYGRVYRNHLRSRQRGGGTSRGAEIGKVRRTCGWFTGQMCKQSRAHARRYCSIDGRAHLSYTVSYICHGSIPWVSLSNWFLRQFWRFATMPMA